MGTIILETKPSGKKSFRAIVRREGQRVSKRFQRRTDANDWVTQIESAIIRGEPIQKLKRYIISVTLATKGLSW